MTIPLRLAPPRPTAVLTGVLVILLAIGLLPVRPAQATTGSSTSAVMVQVDPAVISPDQLTATFKVTIVRAVLPSRGIYLVRPVTPVTSWLQLDQLADTIRSGPGVTRAEVTDASDLEVTRFYGWPKGLPEGVSSDATDFQSQGKAADTALSCARQHSATPAVRTRITVLDTGADLAHPALGGSVSAGYNYVGDNDDVSDTPETNANGAPLDTNQDGTPNSAVGHGTFIAGLIHQLAPQAEITMSKVLDSDGYGNYYVVAQAIREATAAHADIISMSLSTLSRPDSHVLDEAVEQAQRQGILVVAAVGNTRSVLTPKYPAAEHEVLSVGSLSGTSRRLSTFSDWGVWVRVAALGESVRGPLPGGTYGTWSGTSMATGLVAGQAAALFATKAGLDGDDLYAAITGSASRISPTIRDLRVILYGSVNLRASVSRLIKDC